MFGAKPAHRWLGDPGASGRKMLALPPQQRESGVPRYFFDIHDGRFQRDDDGTECADYEGARREAMTTLPEIARFLIPSDGDNQAFTVMVRDEAGTIVYTATLTFAGLKLKPEAEGAPPY